MSWKLLKVTPGNLMREYELIYIVISVLLKADKKMEKGKLFLNLVL